MKNGEKVKNWLANTKAMAIVSGGKKITNLTKRPGVRAAFWGTVGIASLVVASNDILQYLVNGQEWDNTTVLIAWGGTAAINLTEQAMEEIKTKTEKNISAPASKPK